MNFKAIGGLSCPGAADFGVTASAIWVKTA
jgi:hypothetical protein